MLDDGCAVLPPNNKQQLAKDRRQAAETTRIAAENAELRDKVERQEVFMRRRFGEEKKARTAGVLLDRSTAWFGA